MFPLIFVYWIINFAFRKRHTKCISQLPGHHYRFPSGKRLFFCKYEKESIYDAILINIDCSFANSHEKFQKKNRFWQKKDLLVFITCLFRQTIKSISFKKNQTLIYSFSLTFSEKKRLTSARSGLTRAHLKGYFITGGLRTFIIYWYKCLTLSGVKFRSSF